MSFDAEFDFTDMILHYENLRDMYQNILDNIPPDLIASAIGYNQIKAERLAVDTAYYNSILAEVNGYQATVDYINTLVNLDNPNKLILYTFWGFTNRSKANYMYVMASQYTNMLIDSDLIALVNDNVNPSNIKDGLGQIIVARYDIISKYY